MLRVGISGREVARRAKVNDRNCRIVLGRLNLLGVVVFDGAGKFPLYRLNRRHLFFKLLIEPIFSAEPKIQSELFQFLTRSLKGHCLWAGIFGSVSKKTDTASSDLDLLLITKSRMQEESAYKKISALQNEVAEKWGLTLAPLVITTSDWKRKKNTSFGRSLMSSHITLIGKDAII